MLQGPLGVSAPSGGLQPSKWPSDRAHLVPGTSQRTVTLVPVAATMPPPPRVNCTAYAVADGETGEVLLGHASQVPCQIASITKVMTAHLVIKAVEAEQRASARHVALDTSTSASGGGVVVAGLLNELVLVSPEASNLQGTTAELRAGEVYTVRDLLYGTLLPSGNDAASALAEYIGDMFAPPPPPAGASPSYPSRTRDHPHARFVAEMNREAARMGLTATRFGNAHGLSDSKQQSCAADVCRLAALVSRSALFRVIVGSQSYNTSARVIPSKLMRVGKWGLLGASRRVYPCPITWVNTNVLLGSTVTASVQTTMMVRVPQLPHKEAVVESVSPQPRTRQLAHDMLIITPRDRAEATRDAHAGSTGSKATADSTGGSGKLLSSTLPPPSVVNPRGTPDSDLRIKTPAASPVLGSMSAALSPVSSSVNTSSKPAVSMPQLVPHQPPATSAPLRSIRVISLNRSAVVEGSSLAPARSSQISSADYTSCVSTNGSATGSPMPGASAPPSPRHTPYQRSNTQAPVLGEVADVDSPLKGHLAATASTIELPPLARTLSTGGFTGLPPLHIRCNGASTPPTNADATRTSGLGTPGTTVIPGAPATALVPSAPRVRAAESTTLTEAIGAARMSGKRPGSAFPRVHGSATPSPTATPTATATGTPKPTHTVVHPIATHMAAALDTLAVTSGAGTEVVSVDGDVDGASPRRSLSTLARSRPGSPVRKRGDSNVGSSHGKKKGRHHHHKDRVVDRVIDRVLAPGSPVHPLSSYSSLASVSSVSSLMSLLGGSSEGSVGAPALLSACIPSEESCSGGVSNRGGAIRSGGMGTCGMNSSGGVTSSSGVPNSTSEVVAPGSRLLHLGHLTGGSGEDGYPNGLTGATATGEEVLLAGQLAKCTVGTSSPTAGVEMVATLYASSVTCEAAVGGGYDTITGKTGNTGEAAGRTSSPTRAGVTVAVRPGKRNKRGSKGKGSRSASPRKRPQSATPTSTSKSPAAQVSKLDATTSMEASAGSLTSVGGGDGSCDDAEADASGMLSPLSRCERVELDRKLTSQAAARAVPTLGKVASVTSGTITTGLAMSGRASSSSMSTIFTGGPPTLRDCLPTSPSSSSSTLTACTTSTVTSTTTSTGTCIGTSTRRPMSLPSAAPGLSAPAPSSLPVPVPVSVCMWKEVPTPVRRDVRYVYEGIKTGITPVAGACLCSSLRLVSATHTVTEEHAHARAAVAGAFFDYDSRVATGTGSDWATSSSSSVQTGATGARSSGATVEPPPAERSEASTPPRPYRSLIITVLGSDDKSSRFVDTQAIAAYAIHILHAQDLARVANTPASS